MRIDERLHLVLSGGMGFDLTDTYDCNAFALEAGGEWILFDSGAGRYPDQLLAAVDAAGIAPRHLFLTHGHADHSGGAATLRDRFALETWAGTATAALVQNGNEDAIGLTRARAAGIYPADYRFRACPIDHTIDEDQAVTIGDLTIRMMTTPGHSADHVSYFVAAPGRTVLVCGDALFCGGKVAIQDIPDCNIGDVCATVRKLAGRPHDVLLPGHVNFSLRDAGRHALAALSYVERFQCPPSII